MTAVLLLVLAAVGPAGHAPAQEASPDTLRGVVVSGRDSVPVPDRTVVLHRVTPDTGMAVDSGRTGPDGRFAFPLDLGDGDVFLASTRHEGVLYFGGALHGGSVPTDYRIVVYPARPAGKEPGLSVTRRTIVASPEPDGVRFMDAVEVTGSPDATLVAPSGAAAGPWWSVGLPSGVRDVRALPGGVGSDELEVAPARVRLSAPVPVGGQRLVLGYTSAAGGPVAFTPERPVGRFELVVRGDPDVLRVDGLGEPREVRTGEESVRRYSVSSLGPGDTVRITTSGRAGAGSSRRAAWLAAAVGVVLALGAGLAWRWT